MFEELYTTYIKMHIKTISDADWKKCLEIDGLGILAKDKYCVGDYIKDAKVKLEESISLTIEKAKIGAGYDIIRETRFPEKTLKFFAPYYDLQWVKVFQMHGSKWTDFFTSRSGESVCYGKMISYTKNIVNVPFVLIKGYKNNAKSTTPKHELSHVIRINIDILPSQFVSGLVEPIAEMLADDNGLDGFFAWYKKNMIIPCKNVLGSYFQEKNRNKLTKTDFVLSRLNESDMQKISATENPIEYFKSKSNLLRYKIMLERLGL